MDYNVLDDPSTPAQMITAGDMSRMLGARFLHSGLNANSLRTNAFLPGRIWEMIDLEVVRVSADVLNGIADLQALGLTVNTGGIGTTLYSWNQESDMTDASVSMSVRTNPEEDRLDMPLVSVPVPIIAKGFRLDMRVLDAARRFGADVDTSHSAAAARKVAEMQETILFNGSTLVSNGATIPGYRTHANRNTYGAGGDWGTATNIYPTVLAALATLQADNFVNGPYRLYLHADQYNQALALNANTTVPIMRVIESIPGFGPGSVKLCAKMTAGQGVLQTMDRQCVVLAIGQSTIPIEWSVNGGMEARFMVFSCLVPAVKADAEGRSGTCHLSGI